MQVKQIPVEDSVLGKSDCRESAGCKQNASTNSKADCKVFLVGAVDGPDAG